MEHKKRTGFIGLICIAAVLFALSGCAAKDGESSGSGDNGNQVEENEEKTDEKSESKQELSDAYSAYLTVINDNKDAIGDYDWQRKVSSDDVTMNRQTALLDINGDGVPELFFMSSKETAQADLHIYMYEDGEAKELDYNFGSDSGKMSDVQAGAGTNYVIYKGADGDLYFYLTNGDETMHYYIYRFSVSGDKFTQKEKLENHYGPDDSDSGGETRMKDVYKKDGERISSESGVKQFRNAFRKVDTVILFSGYDDNSIWDCFSADDAVSESAGDMIKQLEKGTD